MQSLSPYLHVVRAHKPIGSFLLLWPCLWALWIAYQGMPPRSILLVFISGVIVMRSLGCIINDIADRNIDPFVKRTKNRPLANQTIPLENAIWLATMLSIIALGLLLALPMRTWVYAIFGAVITCIYPLCKRFFYCPQLILGVAFSISIPMAFATNHASNPPATWQLFALAVIWPIIYDTQYALTDIADDQKLGLYSSAIWFGDKVIIVLTLLQALFVTGWIYFAYTQQFHTPSIALISSISGIFTYQLLITQQKEPLQCFQAFHTHNWVGAIIFAAIALEFAAYA